MPALCMNSAAMRGCRHTEQHACLKVWGQSANCNILVLNAHGNHGESAATAAAATSGLPGGLAMQHRPGPVCSEWKLVVDGRATSVSPARWACKDQTRGPHCKGS
jgi:hypothetical protein